MKIKPRYYYLLFNFLISSGMAFFMSLSMHVINVGFHSFFTIWLRNFAISVIISFPVALFLVFAIDRLMKKMFVIK